MTTLSYETAKKLKDAGFPKYFLVHDEIRSVDGAPTLSELIKGCVHVFKSIEYRPIYVNEELRWIATSNQEPHIAYGPTPEEAVANLWLALNSK